MSIYLSFDCLTLRLFQTSFETLSFSFVDFRPRNGNFLLSAEETDQFQQLIGRTDVFLADGDVERSVGFVSASVNEKKKQFKFGAKILNPKSKQT